MKLEVTGLAEAYANLDLQIRKVNEGANEALQMGGQVMKDVIQSNTPVRTGEARDNVAVGNVSTDGAMGAKSVKVGYTSQVAWRMWFLEEGTYSKGNPKGIAPRKMVAKSIDQGGPLAHEAMANSISSLFGG